MWRRKLAKEEPGKPAPADAKTGIVLLQEQIEGARRLLAHRPIKPAEHATWNNATRAYLVRMYGPNSPNVKTIISAPGTTPVWLGMPDGVLERYEASSMENKITMLESCVLRLELASVEANKKKNGSR
jgi:hypothetical protein